MYLNDFLISNQLVGIIKLSALHSLHFLNSLTTLLMKRNEYSVLTTFSSIRRTPLTKFDDSF